MVFIFCDLSTYVGCWSSFYIRRIIYKFLNVCPFDYTAFAVSGKVGYPLNGLTTPVGWLVTPTDRPKSVRNRCVIEVFDGVCVLSFGFRIFCWYRGFCHRTESDLLLFLLIRFEWSDVLLWWIIWFKNFHFVVIFTQMSSQTLSFYTFLLIWK